MSVVSHYQDIWSRQEKENLYPDRIPNSKASNLQEKWEEMSGILAVSNIVEPQIAVFRPSPGKANGAAAIILAGGGYFINAMGHEGMDFACKLNEWGLVAFVVKYRLPSDAAMLKKEIGPLQDAQRSLQWVRERACEWGVDPQRVGVVGFSAGGHLASTAATHFGRPVIENSTRINLRPDFLILGYPVISFQDEITHADTKRFLLGEHPSRDESDDFSNELHVTNQTPPTFLFHAGDDAVVPVENSIRFYQALVRDKVPAELHVYQGGGHGFGLENPTTSDPWAGRLESWMRGNGWLG